MRVVWLLALLLVATTGSAAMALRGGGDSDCRVKPALLVVSVGEARCDATRARACHVDWDVGVRVWASLDVRQPGVRLSVENGCASAV